MTQIKKSIDWESVEREYRAGIKTLRQIGDEHGVSHVAITERADKHGWIRGTRKGVVRSKDTAVGIIPDGVKDEFEHGGFIYVASIESDKSLFKIGMAGNVKQRIDALRTASPYLLSLACAFFVPNMRFAERALHDRYADKRIRGEWFRLSREDLNDIAASSLLIA